MTDVQTVKTNPDPTEAVKEALTLAIRNLDEKLTGLRDGDQRAVVLARDELRNLLTAMDNTISGKFLANKDLVDQLGKANSEALAAALMTQKEIANKSEAAVADQLKQLQLSFETANKATNEKIDRLTSRQDMGEARVDAGKDTRNIQNVDKGHSINIVSVAVGIGGVIVAAIALIFAISTK